MYSNRLLPKPVQGYSCHKTLVGSLRTVQIASAARPDMLVWKTWEFLNVFQWDAGEFPILEAVKMFGWDGVKGTRVLSKDDDMAADISPCSELSGLWKIMGPESAEKEVSFQKLLCSKHYKPQAI